MSGVLHEDQWPLVNISLQLKWHRQKTVTQKPHPRPPCWLWHVECYVLRLMNLLPQIYHYSQCHPSHLKQRGAVLVGCVLSPSNLTVTCSCLPGDLAQIQIAEVRPLRGKHRSAFLNLFTFVILLPDDDCTGKNTDIQNESSLGTCFYL
jgi:hypothetical protein